MPPMLEFFGGEEGASEKRAREEGDGAREMVAEFSAEGGFVRADGTAAAAEAKAATPQIIPAEEQFAVPQHPSKRPRAMTPQPQPPQPAATPPPGPLTPQPPPPHGSKGAVAEMLSHRIAGIAEIGGADDERARLRYDVEARPDVASAEAYAALPVEAFGEALLRGQGWAPGAPIGLHSAAPVAPLEPKRRPGMRLGLGATQESADMQRRLQALRRRGVDVEAANAQRSSQQAPLHTRGTLVAVVGGGRHDGAHAVVKDWQAGQVLVRLHTTDARSLGAQELWMPESDVTIVDVAQLPKDHDARVFCERVRKDRAFMDSPTVAQVLEEHRKKEEEERQKQQEAKSVAPAAPAAAAATSSTAVPQHIHSHNRRKRWIEPGLVVRIVSKRHGSHFYLKKATVADVISEDSCVLEVPSGDSGGGRSAVLEGVRQSQLETVIPAPGGVVLVLAGSHVGCTADLLEKRQPPSPAEPVAVVQFHADMSVAELPFDDVCQFNGEQRM